MTFRTLCIYNGSIHDCVSFNFLESQRLYNSPNQNEAFSPLGRFVDVCWGDCQHRISLVWQLNGVGLTVPLYTHCHIPLLLSVGGSFQSTNLFHVDRVLCPVINHQWIVSSVLLYLKPSWTLINVALQWQNNAQGTCTWKAPLVQELAFSYVLPTLPFKWFPSWAGLDLS